MRVKLEKGVKLNRRGILYVVSAVENTHVLLQELGSTITQAVTRQDFMAEYSSGNLVFLAKGQLNHNPNRPKALKRSLDDYPQALRDEVTVRHAWVEVYMASEKPSLGQAALASIIEAHAEVLYKQFPSRKVPTASSLRRWVKAYIESDGDVLSLVPRHEKKGAKGKTRENDFIIEAQLTGSLEENWLTPHRPSLRSVYEDFRGMLLAQKIETNDIPSYSTMLRRAGQIDYFRRVAKQEGIHVARKKARYVGPGARVSRPMERIQIDTTRLDLFVRDKETNLALGRPYLTFAIDEFTKCNVGYYLSFDPPSIESAMSCLHHAILPKRQRDWFKLSELFEWLACGIPEQVVIDNGLEFKNSAMEDAACSLGFDLILSPPYCPWFKGTVERHFRTLNQRTIHNLPGTTKGSVRERGELDPSKKATLTIDEVKDAIEHFIVTDYHLALSAGSRMTPLERWRESVSRIPLTMPPSAEQLSIVLSRTDERIADSSGIQMFEMRYNSTELHEIVAAHGGRLAVKVKYTANDISTVYVLSPLKNEYVSVQCTARDYAGFSEINLAVHRAILRAAKRRNAEVKDASLVALKAEYVNQTMAKKNHKDTRSKEKPVLHSSIKKDSSFAQPDPAPSDMKRVADRNDSASAPSRDSKLVEGEERAKRIAQKAEELIFGKQPKKTRSAG